MLKMVALVWYVRLLTLLRVEEIRLHGQVWKGFCRGMKSICGGRNALLAHVLLDVSMLKGQQASRDVHGCIHLDRPIFLLQACIVLGKAVKRWEIEVSEIEEIGKVIR